MDSGTIQNSSDHFAWRAEEESDASALLPAESKQFLSSGFPASLFWRKRGNLLAEVEVPVHGIIVGL